MSYYRDDKPGVEADLKIYSEIKRIEKTYFHFYVWIHIDGDTAYVSAGVTCDNLELKKWQSKRMNISRAARLASLLEIWVARYYAKSDAELEAMFYKPVSVRWWWMEKDNDRGGWWEYCDTPFGRFRSFHKEDEYKIFEIWFNGELIGGTAGSFKGRDRLMIAHIAELEKNKARQEVSNNV